MNDRPTASSAPIAGRGRLLATALASLVALGLMLSASPASAHGGEGSMEVTSTTRVGDDVTVAVRLIFIDDGHGVPDATVTIVVDGGTPAPMAAGAEEGDYSGTVTAPPGATIRITSVEPAVTAELTAPEAAEIPETSAPAPAESTEPADTAPSTTAAAPSTTIAEDADADDDSGNGLLFMGIVAVIAVAAVVGVLVLRKPQPDSE